MPTGIVRGEQVLLKFFNGTDYLPFACARTITYNLVQKLIPKSTIGSGDFEEFEVSSLSWNFTLEGVMYLQKPSFVDAEDMLDIWLAKNPVLIVFFITDTQGNQILMNGSALLPQLSPTGSVNNVGSITITGQGTGEVRKGPAVYGNYPDDFQVISALADTPTTGQTTLSLVWNAATPTPDDYTVKITDNTAVTTTTVNATTSNTVDIIVNSAHTYTFSIKSNYGGGSAESSYSPTINWP
jgi:type II secretory pathway pseudopilin PulG